MLFGKKITTVVTVDGMHCGHCSAKVEEALKAIEGVKKVKANLETKAVTIISKIELDSDVIKTVVAEADAPLVTAGIKGGRPSQTIDDIFMDKAKGKEEMLKEFLLKIAVEDQNLVEGYANRLAKYFNTLVHLGIVDNNATAFARYFAKQCSAVSPDSYIRTFRNSKDRNPWDEESERILVNLMDS